MLPMLWLAFNAPAITLAQPLAPVLAPEVIARLVDPPRCLLARCVGGEWQVDAMPSISAGRRRVDGSDLPGAGAALRFSSGRRDWLKPQGSNARVGMQYGVQALKSGDSSVRLSVDTGFRLQKFADDGVGGTGPILRGQVEWQQSLGERTRLAQVTRLETGIAGAYLRNSLQLKMELKPDLILISGLDTRHDSALPGRNQTDATVKLRYGF